MNRHTPGWRTIALVAIAALGACKGSNSSSGGSHVFHAKGGEGLDGNGGEGGYFYAYNGGGGDIQILRSGSVNTSTATPSNLPYLGTNWQDVTEDTTLEVADSGFRLVDESTAVYNDNGQVTGIRVRPGVTLKIKPNFGGTLHNWVRFSLDDALIVEGTIHLEHVDLTTAGDAGGVDTASFGPEYMNSVWIAQGGIMDLSGDASGDGTGATGGQFYTTADTFFNGGTIDARGGAGASGGGSSGGIYVYASEGYAANVGSLLTDGGAGGTGTGGNAGSIYFESDNEEGYYNEYGFVLAKGTFSAIGGDGDAGGGTGGDINFETYYGDVVADGTFRSFGGTALSEGNGGDAGSFYCYAQGNVRIAGSIDTHGGAGAGGGDGGDADYVNVYSYPDYNSDAGEYVPDSQGIFIGADLNLAGGAGANGGEGGDFYLYSYNEYEYQAIPLVGNPIKLVGYPTIDLSGGAGTVDGGDAGYESGTEGGNYNYIYAEYMYDYNDDYTAGSIVNEASWNMKGGDGRDGSGGDGAGLDAETEYYNYPPYVYGLTNTGDLDGTGGSGATYGGAGGYFELWGQAFVKSTGSIKASGGAGGTEQGGMPGYIDLGSTGPITAGALEANGGGTTTGSAYRGGWIYVESSGVATTGSINANGGAATGDGSGGWGGYVWVFSQGSPSSVGPISLAAGAGGGSPDLGEAWVDGAQIIGPAHANER